MRRTRSTSGKRSGVPGSHTLSVSASCACAISITPAPAAVADAPAVDPSRDRLDAGDRARLAVLEHAGEVVRARVRQAHCQRRLARRPRARLRVARRVADRIGRAAERARDGGTQPAGAAEAGGVREVFERQVGLVEQPAREVDALAHQHRARRGAQVLGEQPPEVPLADAEPVGQAVDARLGAEQPQRARHRRRRPLPRRRGGRGLGAAAAARAVAGFLGRGGRGEERHVLGLRACAPDRSGGSRSRSS